MKRIIIIGFFMIFCIHCDIDRQKLLLINTTNDTVYYRLLTDTILCEDIYLYKVLPDDSVRPSFAMGGKGAWDYKINNESKDSTLHIFIFSVENLNDSIIKRSQYKRMDFKVKDLDSLSWTVTVQ